MLRTSVVFAATVSGMWLACADFGWAAPQTSRSVYISVFGVDRQQVHGVRPDELTVKEGGHEYEVTSVTYPSERMHLTIVVEEILAPVYSVRLGILELATLLIPQADIGLVVVGNRAEVLVEHTGDLNAVTIGLNALATRRETRRASNLAEGMLEMTQLIQQLDPARPAIVAVALDTLQTSNEQPGRVLDELRKSRAVFYTVSVGNAGGAWTPNAGAASVLSPNVSGVAMLAEMAARGQILGDGPRRSGGHRFELVNADGLVAALKAVGDELSAQYLVTYRLPDGVEPSDRIEVSISRSGVTLRAPTRIAD